MRRKDPVLLLIEGNPTLRTTLRRYLDRRLPVRLIEAGSGAEAMVLARQNAPDVILLDLSLPDQPGVAVISSLRSIRPEARVIAMASLLDPQHGEAAARNGAWACISKEMLGTELEPLLWRVLPASALSITGQLNRLWAIAQLSFLGGAQRSVAAGIGWIDQNGPWVGQPRTRLLYLANVLAVTVLFGPHAVGF